MRRGFRSAPVPGLILFFLSLSTASGGDNLSPRLLLGFSGSAVGLSGLAADSPVFSPEIEASLQISDSWGAVVSGAITEFTVRFDTPAGEASMPVRTWWLESGVRYQAFAVGDALAVIATVGGGITNMHREEEQIPLGGLGTARIPEATDTRGHVLTGIRLSHEIASPVRLHVGTNIRFLSPFTAPETGYSVYGGLSVEVL